MGSWSLRLSTIPPSHGSHCSPAGSGRSISAPWSNTESCQVHHLQYVIRGRLRIVQDDGSQMDLGPGDFASIPPGHDAWVIGEEPFVCVDFSSDMKQYAQ